MARPKGSKNGLKGLGEVKTAMPKAEPVAIPDRGPAVKISIEGRGEEKEGGKRDKYEIDDAVRTLHRAEEIKGDKELMAELSPHLGKKINSIKGLKKLYAKMCSDGAC